MIYFIRNTDSGYIKVGYTSKDPLARMAYLQVGSAAKLELVGVIDGEREDERALHQALAEHRVAGEWFKPNTLLSLSMRMARAVDRGPRKSCTREFWNGHLQRDVVALTGISQPMLSRIRKGDRRPSAEAALAIQRATGVSAIRLIFGDDADEAFAGFTKASERVA